MSALRQDLITDRPGYAARAAATWLLSQVLDHGRSLTAVLETGDDRYARLPPRDRALARAIANTVLRRHGEIIAVLGGLIAEPPEGGGTLMRILETAAAQLLFMDVADHAAVSLAVDQVAADRAARRYKGLANAVLRRIARDRAALTGTLDADALDTPEWLWRRWSANYGEASARRIAAAHRLEPSLDLSVKSDVAGWADRLGGVVLPTGTVRTIATGPIEDLPGFTEGAWWVQDAAAALPAPLFGDIRGKRVADLCAAPGGKTVALCNAGAKVTAVDVSPERLRRLTANLARLGFVAETVVADVLDWAPAEPFEAVLLDPPCTATGTIRRHPDIAWLKRPADVAPAAERQSRMLDRAVTLLKPGGILVYATCSLEPEEGEEQAARALSRLPVKPLPIAAGEIGDLAEAVSADGTIRTFPYHCALENPRLSGIDGFFIMRLQKV